MKDNPLVPFALDPTELVREAQSRFGWSETDLNSAMATLLGAATSGMRFFGTSGEGISSPLGNNQFPNLFRLFQSSMLMDGDSPHMAMVYGPKPVREAVALHIASITGLQRDAIMDMMPVAATLAIAQAARPYVPEEARELLDAFMRGYARGRPKPMPGPSDYIQGYAEAVQSFWSGFFKPFASGGIGNTAEPEPVEEEPEELDVEPEAEFVEEEASSETLEDRPFDAMVNDWMARSREIQVSQFRAFDSLFERAVKDTETRPEGK